MFSCDLSWRRKNDKNVQLGYIVLDASLAHPEKIDRNPRNYLADSLTSRPSGRKSTEGGGGVATVAVKVKHVTAVTVPEATRPPSPIQNGATPLARRPPAVTNIKNAVRVGSKEVVDSGGIRS